MKKLVLLLALLFIFMLPTYAMHTENPPNISIDQNLVVFSESTGYPFVDHNNRTLVPFRVTLEAFGAEVYWDQQTRTAYAVKDDVTVGVPIGKRYIYVNGERIENDTEAVIVHTRTYLPIRKVAEAFGAEVTWDGPAHTVRIQRPAPKIVLSEDVLEMIATLEDKVIFDIDITMFTLYAFKNHTGYDEENNRGGFHDVRKMVRADLDELNLVLRDDQYFTTKGVGTHHYRQALTYMTGAPDFRRTRSLPDYLSRLNDLDIHLREFYEKVDMTVFFEKYVPYYQAELERYAGPIYPALAKTNLFLRVEPSQIPAFYFQVNLLDAYWSGYGLGSAYTHKNGKGILKTGPSVEPNLKNVVHEYLHGIITPINNQLRSEIESLSYLMARVPQNTQATSRSYNNWFAIFDESVIRALDSKFLDENYDYISHTMADGFILAEFFHERFEDFPDFNGTLTDFLRLLISEIKTEFPR